MKTVVLSAFVFCLPFALTASDGVSFENDVWPILRERCISCHGAPYFKNGKLRKAGGGLRLDAPERIRKGAEENEHVVVASQPDSSSILKRIKRPKDDDEVMPPKGELLTAEQIAIIESWITEGAQFGEWIGLPEEYNYEELKKSWQ